MQWSRVANSVNVNSSFCVYVRFEFEQTKRKFFVHSVNGIVERCCSSMIDRIEIAFMRKQNFQDLQSPLSTFSYFGFWNLFYFILPR